MKTSNKIFLGLIAAIALNVLTGMVFLRSNLKPQGIGRGDQIIKGNGITKTKKFPVANFSKIAFDGNFNIELSQGEELFEITTEENIIDQFSLETNEYGWLKLSAKSGYSIFPKQIIQIKIGFKNLNEIDIAGATTISASDTLKFETLQLNMQDITKSEFPLIVEEQFNIWLKDMAEAKLDGQAKKSKIELADVAKLFAKKVTFQEVDIQTRDMSFASLNVIKKLHASAGDTSTIEYTGQPEGHTENRDMSHIRKK